MTTTVMIVDDSEIMLEAVKEALSKEGHTVITVSDAYKALQTAVDSMPDFIILDIMMPGKSGLELCVDLKTHPLVKDIPIMCVSGSTDEDHIIASFHFGSVDYIKKPVVMADLVDIIYKHDVIKKLSDAWLPAKRELERVISKYRSG